jgi:dGTPase
MHWEQLLSTQRTGQPNKETVKHDRTQFQRDFDRLIFSSPFRRLQDKTQVFPLPGSVFVHNRLTHSLEVASVGRSLGNNLTRKLKEQKSTWPLLLDEIGSVVAAGCLAHDMGNPPFGHSGEKALSEFFLNGHGKQYKTEVSPEEWSDLTDFEGNANALRLLTHQFNGRRKGGFALTYTTIASIIKYPYASGAENLKKYGYFQSEKGIFEDVMHQLGIRCLDAEKAIYARHPLVFLVEAADDICYQIMDLEDAHKLKLLSFEETHDLLIAFIPDITIRHRIDKVFQEVTDKNERIAYLRAMVIGHLVDQCTSIFVDHYDAIMAGEFKKSLIHHLTGNANTAMQVCKTIAFNRVYKHPSVVEIELSGFKILGTLVQEFIQAVLKPNRHYSKMLLPFIPEQYIVLPNASVYQKILSVLDFVSGMTDVYALQLYKKIQGIGLH